MKDQLTTEFLEALNDIGTVLNNLLFKRHSFFEKGFTHFVEYRKENNTRVGFLFGPSDWDIEMIIYTSSGKFAFRDLLNIPEIKEWVNDNRYQQDTERILKNELLWFVELLSVSLPFLE